LTFYESFAQKFIIKKTHKADYVLTEVKRTQKSVTF